MTNEENRLTKEQFLYRAQLTLDTLSNSLEKIKTFITEYAETDGEWVENMKGERPWRAFETMIEEAVMLKKTTWNFFENSWYGNR